MSQTVSQRDVGVQGSQCAVDQYTAFELYTATGARLSGESHRRGIVLPNKLADLVAFLANPITGPVEELLSLKSSFTLVSGRVVYDADGRLSQESCAINYLNIPVAASKQEPDERPGTIRLLLTR
jgi:predicted amidohydrolase YtcJ